ncbi:MAG: hypothetical protein K0R28_5330 [Paenibacillus sp.]|jgi:hypothetical protein|nr:hypothetical protein [Paenibacillus sp.]
MIFEITSKWRKGLLLGIHVRPLMLQELSLRYPEKQLF